MIPWPGARVLVTGASSGLGEAFALGVARRGARPLLSARRTERLSALAGRIRLETGHEASVLPCDLTDPAAREALARDAGEVDVLIANAGAGVLAPLLSSPPEDHRRMVALNVLGVLDLVRALAPGMAARRRGGILTVASTASFQAIPGSAVYAATKAFVRSYTEALAVEMAGTGVSVTCLCPGPTATGFFEAAGVDPERLPLARMGLMAADRAAEAGVKGLERGRGLVIPGLMNRLGAFSTRLAPRRWSARVAGHFMGFTPDR